MSNHCSITFTGNVGTEPERHEFESGAVITKFTVGVGRYDRKTKTDVTDWFKVETFSKLGAYIVKGKKILVDGRMITNVYENKDKVKVKDYIVVDADIELLTPKSTESAQGGTQEDDEDDNIGDDEIPYN